MRRSRATGEGISRPPDPDELRAIQALAVRAEKLRKLRFRTAVDIRIEDRKKTKEFIRSKIRRDEIERSLITYKTLGVLPKDTTVDELSEAERKRRLSMLEGALLEGRISEETYERLRRKYET